MVEKITRLTSFILGSYLLFAGCFMLPAKASGVTLISDAQTQNYLAQIVKPLFGAANIHFNANNIFIVDDSSLNAFVSDGNYMFVHTGTIIQADNTNELAGILAHETGHIMGGHIVRMKLKMENMSYVMLGSVLAAGAAAVSTGRGDAAAAILLGSQSSAISNMLHYQVQEERSADESAIKLLSKTKQSAKGLLSFMNKIKKRNQLSGIKESDYFSNHPMTSERIAHFAEACKENEYATSSPLDNEFKLVRAKLAAFLLDENKVKRMYPLSDKSAPARYARSITAFKKGKTTMALSLVDGLIKEQPDNPYFYEFKGQILFESGKVKASVEAYKKALVLLPNNYLLQISLAQALLESSEDVQNAKEAVVLLQKSLVSTNSAFSWMLLSQAYERLGQKAASLHAAAEFSYAIGRIDAAVKQLKQAENNAPNKALQLKINDLKQKIKDERR